MTDALTPTAGSPTACGPSRRRAFARFSSWPSSLKDPVNLSIGQPDFDVPEPIKAAAHAAIDAGRNAYTVTQGIPELRAKIAASLRSRFAHPDREVFITSGTSGGLVLALCCTVNPGDEVIVFDPYFVMYPHLRQLAGGKMVHDRHLSGFRPRCR